MSIEGSWSIHAVSACVSYVLPGFSPDPAPSAYYAALFTDDADPDGGGNTEPTTGGYVRKAVTLTSSGLLTYHNTAHLVWPPISAVSIAGLALMDDLTAGDAWAWWNFPVALDATGGIRLASGELVIRLSDTR